MPRKTPVKIPPYIVRLRNAIDEELSKLDIAPTEVSVEPIARTNLFRFRIVAPKFSKLRHIERQDLVWRVVRLHLGDDEQLRISTITTVTPSEAKEVA